MPEPDVVLPQLPAEVDVAAVAFGGEVHQAGFDVAKDDPEPRDPFDLRLEGLGGVAVLRALGTAASDLPTSAGLIHVLSAVPRRILQSVAVTIRPADSDDASGRAERVFYRAAGGRSVAWNAGPASLSDKRETQNGTRCVCRVPFCVMSGGVGN